MAERHGTGLSFGQLITLTFGFLLASVVIFFFGYVVGVQVAGQRPGRGREIARVPVGDPPPAPTALPTVEPVATALQPTVVPPPPTATVLRVVIVPTIAPVARASATRPAAAARPTPAKGEGWTVQAYATNDTVRAVMLARTLRSKGYDASTGTRPIGRVTWYVVRVGRFSDRAAAKALEAKLRSEEGLEAASVVAR